MGLYCCVLCADGTLARADTKPVTAWVGQGAPFSKACMSASKSSTAVCGMCIMSCLDMPSGPTAANLFLEATALNSIWAVMGGNCTGFLGDASCMKPTMASHCVTSAWSCFCQRGAHSCSKAWRMAGISASILCTTSSSCMTSATSLVTRMLFWSTTCTCVSTPLMGKLCKPSGIAGRSVSWTWASSAGAAAVTCSVWSTTMVWTGSALSLCKSL